MIDLKKKIKRLPNKFGVYKFFDKQKKLIYVGKSKNIKTRVHSYFSKKQLHLKTATLVSKITDVKYVVVENETDALLLENNLIKKEKPKYNVLLKDDKTYPWICISNDEFPKVFQTRIVQKDGAEYYGPYMSSHLVKLMLDYISDMFYDNGWTPFSYLNKSKKPETKEQYLKIIAEARKIIRGNTKTLISNLSEKMTDLANKMAFEKAQKIKESIALIKKYQSKSVVVSSSLNNIDVFSIVAEEKYAYINYLKIHAGAVIISHTIEIQKKLNEETSDILKLAIIHLRDKFKSKSKTICVPIKLTPIWEGIIFQIPIRGEKKKLLNLSFLNTKHLKIEMKKRRLDSTNKKANSRVLITLKKDLKLTALPIHIECFDNSNLNGTNPVAACVVFRNGLPAKKDYRNFNIQTVGGIDDYASMEEVVFRRYNRLLKEKKELPQLIVVDGGKGQLSSAKKSLDKLKLKIQVIGIAKRLEEVFFPDDPIPLYLDKTSESLRLIQRIRNEAHRFAITHHRKKRITTGLTSSLDMIPGIGKATIKILISYFGSVNKIKTANRNELEKVIGISKSEKILKYYS